MALADIAALLGRAGRGRHRDLFAVRRVAVAEAGGAGGVGFELDRRQVVAVDEAVGGADAADIGVGQLGERPGRADLDLGTEEISGLGGA